MSETVLDTTPNKIATIAASEEFLQSIQSASPVNQCLMIDEYIHQKCIDILTAVFGENEPTTKFVDTKNRIQTECERFYNAFMRNIVITQINDLRFTYDRLVKDCADLEAKFNAVCEVGWERALRTRSLKLKGREVLEELRLAKSPSYLDVYYNIVKFQ